MTTAAQFTRLEEKTARLQESNEKILAVLETMTIVVTTQHNDLKALSAHASIHGDEFQKLTSRVDANDAKVRVRLLRIGRC